MTIRLFSRMYRPSQIRLPFLPHCRYWLPASVYWGYSVGTGRKEPLRSARSPTFSLGVVAISGNWPQKSATRVLGQHSDVGLAASEQLNTRPWNHRLSGISA